MGIFVDFHLTSPSLSFAKERSLRGLRLEAYACCSNCRACVHFLRVARFYSHNPELLPRVLNLAFCPLFVLISGE